MRRAVVGLAIEALVFQEQNGIVGPDGGPEQATGVERVGREHDPQAGNVGEDRFAALAVINRAAAEVSADRNAYDDGRGKAVMRAPPQIR